jgi:Rad3-related DNA helicase
VLNEWQLSPDGVFIAAGFEEGLDLKGDDYQWQAIAKVQYPSLGDSAIRRKAQESDEWYQWSALRKVIQAYGRISRSETDFGVTYILDEMFDRLIEKCNGLGLIPTSFREVI